MIFWHRAGQRCITALFGPQIEDFLPPRTAFGTSSKTLDPLMEARNSVIQKQHQATEAVTGNQGRVTQYLAKIQEKRSVLMTVLNSVEHWLRTGSYGGMQLHQKRKAPETVGTRLFRPGAAENSVDRESLAKALDRGMEDSIREALATGESEEEARAAAKVLRDNIEGALNYDRDGNVNLSDIQLHMPREVVNASLETLKLGALNHATNDADDLVNAVVLTDEDISEGAFEHAVNCISASMCQGPMVHHEFDMTCFLSSKYAVNKCADCDADVHLLSACFLGTRLGSCTRCNRPRCIPCTSVMHSKCKPGEPITVDPTRTCLRCKPLTRADELAAKIATVAEAFSDGVGSMLAAAGTTRSTPVRANSRRKATQASSSNRNKSKR